ncbi:fatty acid desaturase family protein [Tabrizicola sp.]|uniref:fatty acid desaturase family protein n=1 Tax=Tabrizicola sp. TaxID=2005166 RepID=UPI001A621D8C|nr:fatty acid desaturase family protein [Tabrizicola sp.]MBL9072168.1 fatty acid desaturase family protein [Tabrizicola sp.]
MARTNRDYALLGRDARLAEEIGLVSAAWYHTEIPRKLMKDLMQRGDLPAIRDTIILFATMIGSAAAGIWLWPSWWSAPFWAIYGVLYASAMDSRWHECGHGTAFRTRWMNDALYQIACFCMLRNPVVWRWSHARHHTDTIIVGHDPEIIAMRPAVVARLILNFFGLFELWGNGKATLQLIFGHMPETTCSFVPASEQPKAFRIARIWGLIYLSTAALAVWLGSILPFMVIGMPILFGSWHMVMTGYMQHLGLAENVLDHRLNSRTVYINPVSRFIYWNMNYHVEHHMFPMVPYHALPRLHALIRHDLPPAHPSILSAYAEIIPTLARQFRNPDWFVKRQLPATAKPYRPEFHGDLEPGQPTPGIGGYPLPHAAE